MTACHGYVMLCHAWVDQVSEKIRRDANQFVRKKDRVTKPSKQQGNRSMVKGERNNTLVDSMLCHAHLLSGVQ